MSPLLSGTPPRQTHATTLIALTLLVVASGGMFVYAGDALHRLLGTSSFPVADGAEPLSPGHVRAWLPHQLASDGTQVSPVALTPDSQATSSAPTSVVVPAAAFPDQPSGERLLLRAEQALRALDWNGARVSASRLDGLAVAPATSSRAREILQHSAVIETLFRQLGDHSELSRSYDTDPSLLALGDGPHPTLIVPLDEAGQVVQADPAGYVLRQSQSRGMVSALIQGKSDFIRGQITVPITSVHLVDQVQVHAQKERALAQQIRVLDNQPDAATGIAWYEIAKFAYRNRLDEQVPPLLERAIAIDPGLLTSVREMLAGRLLAMMVFHLQSHNQMAADADLARIRKRFADTAHGRQAECYLTGDTHGLIALAARQDPQGMPTTIHGQAPTPAAPLPGGMTAGTAAERFTAGMLPYGAAIDMPLCDERNRLFLQAQRLFSQSATIYAGLCSQHPDDEDLQARMVNARFFMEACIHYQTAP